MAQRKRDSNGNIVYRESDRIYNERRRAKRRLARMQREEAKAAEGKSDFERESLRTESRKLEKQIKQSYKKTNLEGYKGVARQLKRDNDVDFQRREDQRLTNAYTKEWKKVQKQGIAGDYNQETYVESRKAGAEWYTTSQGDRINVDTGEMITEKEFQALREEEARIEYEGNFGPIDIQPRDMPDFPSRLPETYDIDYGYNKQQNSLFNLAMKYASKPKQDATSYEEYMSESFISEEQRKTFFAMIQPFRAEYPGIDSRELYKSIMNWNNVNDREANLRNYFDMYEYVMSNPNWKKLAFGMEEWQLPDFDWEDVSEEKYRAIAAATSKISQRILQTSE